MKAIFESIELVKNTDKEQFELTYNGSVAFIVYKELSNSYALIHTESPEELAGTGTASALVEKTLNFIKDEGKTVSPYCPFVYAYIKKHPEWKTLVNRSFPKYDELQNLS